MPGGAHRSDADDLAAFTEAMYLLGEAGGWIAEDALWALVEQGDVEIAEQELEQRGRMRP